MKIYLVSQGEYSDRGIVAACSTLEKAEDVRKRFELDNEIEIYEIDELHLQINSGLHPHFVHMDIDGNVIECYPPDDSLNDPLNDYLGVQGPRGVFRMYQEHLPPEKRNMYVGCMARDKEHAIKIANDTRAILIAENRWGIIEW